MGNAAASQSSPPSSPTSSPTPFAAFTDPGEIVAGIPLDRQIICLGESTHGTEEFYAYRAAITQKLITERGFTAVVFEADWPLMSHVNDYTNRCRASPFPRDDAETFPKWMWRNEVMNGFFTWCRGQPAKSRPSLFGMDCYSLFESKKLLLAFLNQHDPDFAKDVTKRLAYTDKYDNCHEYAFLVFKFVSLVFSLLLSLPWAKQRRS